MLSTIREKWPEILNNLKKEHDISDVSFKTWLLPLEVRALEGDTIIIVVPEETIGLQYIKKKYYTPLKVCIEETIGRSFDIEFILPEQLGSIESQKKIEASQDKDIFEKSGLNPK